MNYDKDKQALMEMRCTFALLAFELLYFVYLCLTPSKSLYHVLITTDYVLYLGWPSLYNIDLILF